MMLAALVLVAAVMWAVCGSLAWMLAVDERMIDAGDRRAVWAWTLGPFVVLALIFTDRSRP